MRDKSGIAGSRLKWLSEKIKPIWERVLQSFYWKVSFPVQDLAYGLALEPFSADDWIAHIVGMYSSGKKCTIEIEPECTEILCMARWKCLSEGQLLSQGHLMILEVSFERIVHFYLDDPYDTK